jgi:drug/metabolite transporter (DMT)-like permease
MTTRVAANLAVLYVVWGSTYLAITVLDRTIPPLYGMGARFLLAGTVMALWCAMRRRGGWPTRRQLGGAALTGALILGVAYGLLAVAQRTVPSGLAAVLIASVPLWGVGLRAVHRESVPGTALLGVVIGLAGVALLVLPSGTDGVVSIAGVVMLVVAALAEAAGAFYTPRLPHPDDVLTTASVQMLVAGLLLTGAALVTGEPFDLPSWSLESWVGLLYLVVPGSLLAYASLLWLLATVPVWLATSYAYVNPAVALLLGWAILHERLDLSTVFGSVLVIISVAFIARRQPETV